jgi:hypothetical protein
MKLAACARNWCCEFGGENNVKKAVRLTMTFAAAEPDVATPAPGSFRVLLGPSAERQFLTEVSEIRGFTAGNRKFRSAVRFD